MRTENSAFEHGMFFRQSSEILPPQLADENPLWSFTLIKCSLWQPITFCVLLNARRTSCLLDRCSRRSFDWIKFVTNGPLMTNSTYSTNDSESTERIESFLWWAHLQDIPASCSSCPRIRTMFISIVRWKAPSTINLQWYDVFHNRRCSLTVRQKETLEGN